MVPAKKCLGLALGPIRLSVHGHHGCFSHGCHVVPRLRVRVTVSHHRIRLHNTCGDTLTFIEH